MSDVTRPTGVPDDAVEAARLYAVAYMLWQLSQGYILAEDRDIGENWMAQPVESLHPDDAEELPGWLDAAREVMALSTQADTGEVERLRAWKAEALPIMTGLQELGRALGLGLGQQITARNAVDAALDLRNERDAAVARLDEFVTRVRELLAEASMGATGPNSGVQWWFEWRDRLTTLLAVVDAEPTEGGA